ncbi:D-ribitol-5-phosphate cytidylyltransferase isoform X1 [Lingula anatina]|uniref:2-C-methyl-D-erythritol 4-phosphate cytidylyltransferase, chloroplastic n=1 Tax=Lingula anatina TaxID=7574 RepID=A0A1S3HXX6_LINAN|nr:D-ribitol-5-phosphate cytidylyltransferase isoform X1 [Lingula anatina]|eukprot:XP_013390863.1 D-ribitol-5-phosphate cytidylyltransferase isoform X1 [Lingula anatina]
MADSPDYLVCAVLPAGGCGERTGMKTPKQYCQVLSRPLVAYTLQAFERVPWIKHIVITIHNDYKDLLLDVISTHNLKKIHIVGAGPTRHRSIWEGIKSLGKVCPVPEVVIIHDAVRPFVESDILWKIVEAARECGAAGAIRPLVSTILAVDGDGFLDHSLDRSKYRASEMPQAFQYNIIKTAYEKCTDYDFDYGTECLHLAQRYGGAKVRLIDGPDSLWKVTLKKDLAAAEDTIKDWKKNVVLVNCPEKIQSEVSRAFELQNFKLHITTYGAMGPSSANHYIIFHTIYNQQSILQMSKDFLNNYAGTAVVTTVLHVVTTCQLGPEDLDYFKVQACIQRLQENVADDVCVALLFDMTDSPKKLIELLLTLVRSQNPILGGQIYTILADS